MLLFLIEVNLVASDQASNVARVRDALVKFQKQFKKHKTECISISIPYTFHFFRLFGMFLPIEDGVYKQVSVAENVATILWYNKEDKRWRFSSPEQYKSHNDECFAYFETELTSLPFQPGMLDAGGDIQYLAKNKDGDFEPLEYCKITSGAGFIERLGIDKMEFKEKRGWFKRKFGKKTKETQI